MKKSQTARHSARGATEGGFIAPRFGVEGVPVGVDGIPTRTDTRFSDVGVMSPSSRLAPIVEKLVT